LPIDPYQSRFSARDLVQLLAGSSAIALVTAAYQAWFHITNPTIVALSFLLVVLLVAAVSTLWVAVAISLMAFVCFNFFFLPPVRTFTIADPENWAALFTLLAISIVAIHLSSQARRKAEEAMARRDELARLFALTRDILLITDPQDAVAIVAQWIRRRFEFERVAICLPDGDRWNLHQSDQPSMDFDWLQLDAAFSEPRASLASSADNSRAGHARIEARDGARAWIVPLRVGVSPLGLLALAGGSVEPGTRDALAGVAAIAIERTHLLEHRNEAEVMRRSAELKSALLASLSHDLKTPLTAVTVAANNLNASWLTPEQRREQTGIVVSELGRLNHLFRDVVDMAKIETEAVVAEREWVQPAEIAEAAARQVESALDGHRVTIDDEAERAFVKVDPQLTSAALAHLLENAAQYSPAGSAILVRISVTSNELRIAVRDHGPGVVPDELDRLFERSYRGAAARRDTFGTGMGLAITRGLLAAEDGRVWAENHPEGGAVFTISVPADTQSSLALEGQEL
jgi:two-component system, OmpR family, sensor histidine kinase KdpD